MIFIDSGDFFEPSEKSLSRRVRERATATFFVNSGRLADE